MRIPLVLLVTFALAFAGCTAPDDSMDDGMDDGGDGGDAGGTMPAGEDNTETHHISIEDFQFGDGSLTITQGDTVVWTNNDSVAHTVDSTDGTGELDSGNIAPGATFEWTFDDAGTFEYRCDLHPSMTGEIVVESLAAS